VTALDGVDRFDVALAQGAGGLLQAFNQAGVLATSDLHVALRLCRLSGTVDDVVQLGVAFAARAPRLGHVCVDLQTIRDTASSDSDSPFDLGVLPWAEPDDWVRRMSESAVVGPDLPLQLEGANLYLNRLWTDERSVATDLRRRAAAPVDGVDDAVLRAGLARLFVDTETPDLQRMAAATAVLRNVSVIAGGPGTGKTTTVARVLALILEQHAGAGARPPRIALAAPTGKAAARLEEAVRGEASVMETEEGVRAHLGTLEGTTLHRLLGFNPGNRTRFRHNRNNHLPHDVVVIDETSMVSLTMMARVTEAVRPGARLILVGDPEQLASVEAGAVLGDIVGPVADGFCMDAETRSRLAAVTADTVPLPVAGAISSSGIGNGIVLLRRVHRFGGAIAEFAEAIQRGDATGALGVLRRGDPELHWIPEDAGEVPSAAVVDAVRSLAIECGRQVIQAARAGEARESIAALGRFRLLCAHRRGPEGVAAWMAHVESWLRAEVPGFAIGSAWYVGRPLIVTENDYGLELYNGDTGVVVSAGDRLVAAFQRGDGVAEVSPARLAAVDTVYAMTVHKSQGSQFDVVAFLLPSADSRVLTRELLYTAATRARERLILVGTEDLLRTAIERPITRASGLRRALWGEAEPTIPEERFPPN